jgi:hypothetical protein
VKTNKRDVLIIASLSTLALILGSAFLIAYSSATASSPLSMWSGQRSFKGWYEGGLATGVSGRLRGGFSWRGCCGPVEVSEEFKEKVISIAKADEDVQNLLNSGYNVTAVRPVIKTVVEGDGSVVMRATGAVITLVKDKMSRATVKVDLENARVTEVTVLTRTVIEKP